jgi:hypothetical protein
MRSVLSSRVPVGDVVDFFGVTRLGDGRAVASGSGRSPRGALHCRRFEGGAAAVVLADPSSPWQAIDTVCGGRSANFTPGLTSIERGRIAQSGTKERSRARVR